MKSTVHENYMNSTIYEREKYMKNIQVQEIKWQWHEMYMTDKLYEKHMKSKVYEKHSI